MIAPLVPGSLPTRPWTTARRLRAGGWQVFGLVGGRRPDAEVLLAVASQARAQCVVTAVVPTHRCGAVPDSHRVPSCLVSSRVSGTRRTSRGIDYKHHDLG